MMNPLALKEQLRVKIVNNGQKQYQVNMNLI